MPDKSHFRGKSSGKNGHAVMALCVLTVDDFEPWRKFVCSALQDCPHLRNILEVSDGLDAVHKARELQPDLILLDIGLPKLNGLEAARQIRVLAPYSKIIFLTETHDLDVAAEGFRSGARGFVVKSNAKEELLAAVDAVLAGKRFLSRRLRNVPTDQSQTHVATASD
jgi:DNA-binding NarL/FixJ family response regulator